ncbi:hypothetical protein Taro_039118 [Colocasia esculenta]|uniref:Uncharacterized protein n=1 Tax=Colocasia esculenta TaxID=4460 RepID=A0A843WFQ5_COLES|nr:hypothetical protein [Colocasia esculenta]
MGGREPVPPWGGATGVGNLAERLGGLAVGEERLFQVMKAVEDAENTIKQQPWLLLCCHVWEIRTIFVNVLLMLAQVLVLTVSGKEKIAALALGHD